jgi:hypothetical protein
VRKPAEQFQYTFMARFVSSLCIVGGWE